MRKKVYSASDALARSVISLHSPRRILGNAAAAIMAALSVERLGAGK
jgi:hypothetical protein